MTIRVYFHGEKIENDRAREFESVEALEKHLDSIPGGTGCEIVIRIPPEDADKILFELSTWRTEVTRKANERVSAVVMPLAKAYAWGQSLIYPDGGGWRLIWSATTIMQPPTMPQIPGLRR